MTHDHDCDGCDDDEPCEDCIEAARIARMQIGSIAIRTHRSYPPKDLPRQSDLEPMLDGPPITS